MLSPNDHLNGGAVMDLNPATLLGRGNGRDCYAHPYRADLVIKVRRQNSRTRDQNRFEWLYLSSLTRRQVPFDHIPRLQGWVATTQGQGLVCERIADANGRGAPSLIEAVRRGLLTHKHAEVLLDDLFNHLLRHWVAFADVGRENLVWQPRSDDAGRLVIIDGLGARHPGLKLWLHSHVPFLARRKTRKNWPRAIGRLPAVTP